MQVVGDLRQTPKGWFMVPVGMLTTQQREYVALHKAATTEVPDIYAVKLMHTVIHAMCGQNVPVSPLNGFTFDERPWLPHEGAKICGI